MDKVRKLYVCKKCGMTHYNIKKPIKCRHCGRVLGKLNNIPTYQC